MVISDAVRSVDGEAPRQLDEAAMLLGDEEPEDSEDRRAWRTFAKLRAWLKSKSVEPNRIVGATVFTTENPYEVMQATRSVVHADDPPVLVGEPVLCEAGTRSPCASPSFEGEFRDPRDCPANPSDAYHEIHAKVRLPVFQTGEPPYVESGGQVEIVAGAPKIQRHEEVCMSITIPKGVDMPDTGWPVIIYGHGTGGSFRNQVQLLAPGVSHLALPDGRETAVAVVGIDQSMHGPRQGEEQGLDPGPLFFNVSNPEAARGNVFQGAADNFSLVRWVKGFDDSLPGAGETRFDAGHVYYDGHSQGGTTGPLFVPYEDDLRGVAFSGCAGSLVFSMLGKKLPYDSSVGVRLALQELDIDETHPVLHLFQFYFDAVDPLIYAPLLYREPVGAPVHTLHIYGRDDHFTPDIGQRAYAAATGGTLGVEAEPGADFDEIEDLAMRNAQLPLSGNIRSAGQRVTGVTIQQAPDGEYDGHFVAQRNAKILQQLTVYLGTLVLDEFPIVPQP